MKLNLFAVIISVVSALIMIVSSCSKEQTRSDQPMLVLEPGTADFGRISKDDPIAFHEVSITVRNVGKQTLQIETIELPEGFSYELVPSRKSIEGGDKAILKVILDVRRVRGPVSGSAYVVCNAPSQPRAPIALQANVEERQGDEAPLSPEAPDIEFDHRAFDFGPLLRSKMVEHRYPFSNRGKKPLKILGINTMCLCVTAYTTKIEIAPGESAEIVARLEPYKYDGNSPWKALSITTNDPAEQIANISIAATIVDEAVLEPDSVVLPHVQAGHEARAQVKLLRRGAQELLVKRVVSSSAHIQATALSLEEENGYLIDVAVLPTMPNGKFEEIVTVFTNYEDYSIRSKQGEYKDVYKDYSRLRLPVKGTVSGTISLSPQKINFGACAPGETVRRKLTLTSSGPELRIQAVSCSDPAFRALQVAAEAGLKQEITIEFLPRPPDREISGEVVILTNDEEFRVPVFAVVKQAS